MSLYSCKESRSNDCLDYLINENIYKIDGKIALSEGNSLNFFYDLYINDLFTMFLDQYNDTILKICRNADLQNVVLYGMKGQGPNDFNTPLFCENNAILNNSNNMLDLIDINLLSTQHVLLSEKESLASVNVKSRTLPTDIPFISECNITSNFIYGVDLDPINEGLFCIYDKNSKQLSRAVYPFIEESEKYSEQSINELYKCGLAVNEEKNSVCAPMRNINCIAFYDIRGNLVKNIVIGEKINFPIEDTEILDFPQSPKYIKKMYATKDFIYCLYDGTKNYSGISKILVFSWDGTYICSLQTTEKLINIAVHPKNEYLIATIQNEDGGIDVIEYSLMELSPILHIK